MQLRLFLTLALCQLTHCAPPSPQTTAQVQLGRTTLIGLRIEPLGQEFFGNIPFAEAPVGALRFAPPIGKFWLEEGPRDASDFGVACPQSGLPISEFSEDCLTINVLRPTGAVGGVTRGRGLPVMVWTYGGGFSEGSASDFNGSMFVDHSVRRGTPVIYVNFNYRLGPLGFPQGSEAKGRGALNLGLKDILTALEWVQRNIGAFGGDSSKVAVFGESAGSIALHQLLLAKGFGKLARAAIFQSGSAASAFIFPPERRSSDWNNFVAAVSDCADAQPNDSFSCLRRANVTSLVAATAVAYAKSSEQFPFQPAIDGPGGVLPDLPSKLWDEGKFAKIPFLAGTCEDEGTVFIPPTFNSTTLLRQWIIANSSPSEIPPSMHMAITDKLLELYPNDAVDGSPFNTGNQTFGLSSQYKRAAAYIGDLAFQSQRRSFMEKSAKLGVRGFGYIFTEVQPVGPQFLGFANYTGVFHSSDVVYTYGQVVNGTDAANALSRNMMDYWISFGTSVDPNDMHGNTSRPRWNQYTSKNKMILELNGEKLRMVPDDYRAKQIEFINSVPVALRH